MYTSPGSVHTVNSHSLCTSSVGKPLADKNDDCSTVRTNDNLLDLIASINCLANASSCCCWCSSSLPHLSFFVSFVSEA